MLTLKGAPGTLFDSPPKTTATHRPLDLNINIVSQVTQGDHPNKLDIQTTLICRQIKGKFYCLNRYHW